MPTERQLHLRRMLDSQALLDLSATECDMVTKAGKCPNRGL